MGEVFAGRYELIDLIGVGGMGAVWRARDLRQDRIVAAKVLRQSDATMLLRFVREQGMRVHHPHIVVPLGWAGEDDQVLFTMPIIAGGSVANLIEDHGPLPPRFVAEVLRQLLSAIVAVHGAQIVHRDIKPANILMDATGVGRPHAYLTDFGIAVDLRGPRLTEVGYITGTPGYLAPELESFGAPGPAADLYALGMVTATMLTAIAPTELDVHGRPTPPWVPDQLWTLVKDLTRTEPSDRPTVEQAMARLEYPGLSWTSETVSQVAVLSRLPPLGLEAVPLRSGALPNSPVPGQVGVNPLGPTRPNGLLWVPDKITNPSSSLPRQTIEVILLSVALALILIGLLVTVWGSS